MKRGTVREDGKIFARTLYGKEIWLTKEQYEQREKTRKEYTKKCTIAYRKMRKEVRSFGDYDHVKNLYFIGISTSGKEVWKNKAFLEKFRQKQNNNKKKYNERCKLLPETNLKFGDPHPENPNLFVTLKIGNKCFFGDKKALEEKKERLRMISLKRHYKAKKVKQMAMRDIEVKKRRGDTREEDNFIFFGYSRVGKEIWYPPTVFQEKRNKENLKRREKRKRVKEKRMQNHCVLQNIAIENQNNTSSTNEVPTGV